MNTTMNTPQVLLTVDIGNTTTSFALFKEDRILDRRSLPTHKLSGRDLLATLKYFKKKDPRLDACVVCSVVPRALRRHKSALQRLFPGRLFVAGENLKVPLKNAYQDPRQVGQDRLACAYAVKEQYRCPAVVIDLGTAMTIDVVSARGEYQGGMIVPGIGLSLKALFENTALLPLVSLRKPSSLIGRNTAESILSGVFYGYSALIEGVVAKIEKKLKAKPVVVLTGGYGHVMGKYLNASVDHFDPDLIFKGLMLSFRETRH